MVASNSHTEEGSTVKLLRSRHAEYIIMSVLVPLGAMLIIWLLDMHITDLKSPGVTSSRLVFASGAMCIMLWWIISIFALAYTPGYGKYAFYIFLLPVWTVVVNSFLDNNHATLMGLDLEVLAVIAVMGLTWLGSIVVCLIDWYQFNHREFSLPQERIR